MRNAPSKCGSITSSPQSPDPVLSPWKTCLQCAPTVKARVEALSGCRIWYTHQIQGKSHGACMLITLAHEWCKTSKLKLCSWAQPVQALNRVSCHAQPVPPECSDQPRPPSRHPGSHASFMGRCRKRAHAHLSSEPAMLKMPLLRNRSWPRSFSRVDSHLFKSCMLQLPSWGQQRAPGGATRKALGHPRPLGHRWPLGRPWPLGRLQVPGPYQQCCTAARWAVPCVLQ